MSEETTVEKTIVPQSYQHSAGATVRRKYPLAGIVLAGGRSMRMGVDKTQVLLSGRPLLAHAVESLCEFTSSCTIVTNRPDDLPLEHLPKDLSVITDEIAYQGPLGGLASALPHIEEEWVLVTAADMPWVSPELIEYLWSQREGFDVVVPVSDEGPEPLLALYRTKPTLEAAQAVIESGRRRIVAMYPELRVREVTEKDLREVDPELASFFNVNTQEDLLEARERAGDDSLNLLGTEDSPEIGFEIPHVIRRNPVRVMLAAEAGRQVPEETPITIYLNDIEVATVQATPEDIEDMAVGFLFTEGLVRDRAKFLGVDLDKKRGLAYVTSEEDVPDDLVYKTRYITSGCGKGITFSSLSHARGLAPVSEPLRVSATRLYEWMSEMSERSEKYREHGGYHSCGLAVGGALVLVREDVGRHNAVDKLLGHAWMQHIDTTRAVLLSSGRVSYEMMVKAAKARIPIVVSRSAATDLAVDIADDLGITIGGYLRGGKIVVYAHPERIFVDEDNDEG